MWDQRYSTPEYVYGKQPNRFLHDQFKRIPVGKVLCLADGEGRNGVFLARMGYEVTSVDSSGVALKKAEALASEQGTFINTVHEDLEDFPFVPETWSGIISVFCHLPANLRREVHKASIEALRPEGIFLLEAYSPEQLGYATGGPKDPALLYALEDLLSDFSALEIIHAEHIVRDVTEGTLHTGKASVVQLIAKKNG